MPAHGRHGLDCEPVRHPAWDGASEEASRDRRRPAMSAPLVPCRESSGWVINGFTAVEFAWRWDVDAGSPLGKLLIGHGPRRVWRCGLALIKSSPLLGWDEFEVAHLHHRAAVCCCLPQSGALVPAPEAEVDHDVGAKFECAQSDLDEPSFDHVLSRWRILVPIERLHPFILRETKCHLLDLDAPRSSGLPGAWKSHRENQCWCRCLMVAPYPSGRLMTAAIRSRPQIVRKCRWAIPLTTPAPDRPGQDVALCAPRALAIPV